MDQTQLRRAVQVLGIEHKDIRYEETAVPGTPIHPFEEFARIGLARMDMSDTTLVVERDKNVVVNAYAVPSSLQTEGSKELQARVVKAEAAATAANDRAQRVELELKEYIRSQVAAGGPTMEDIRGRIRNELNRTPETPERKTTKKRSSKKRRRPQTPEGEEGENG